MTLDAGLYHLNIKLSVINVCWEMLSHLTFRKSRNIKGLGQTTYNNLLSYVEINFFNNMPFKT